MTGTMRLRTYSVLRAAGFLALYFFALPSALVLLNERLGWPRWESPVFDASGIVETFGEEYEEYCRRAPRWPRPRSAARPAGHPGAGRLGW